MANGSQRERVLLIPCPSTDARQHLSLALGRRHSVASGAGAARHAGRSGRSGSKPVGTTRKPQVRSAGGSRKPRRPARRPAFVPPGDRTASLNGAADGC